jgi:hypothetical protein
MSGSLRRVAWKLRVYTLGVQEVRRDTGGTLRDGDKRKSSIRSRYFVPHTVISVVKTIQ